MVTQETAIQQDSPPQEQRYTADDLWEIAHADSTMRYELVRGELQAMPPTGGEHGETTFSIGLFIGNYVRQHKLGRVTAAETGFILAEEPHTVRAPDVGFISAARAIEPLPRGYIPGPPDLAVEVVSPGDGAGDIEDKVVQYLGAGTRQVWVVYPSSRTVVVHTAEGVMRLSADDTLDGGDVLPGFTLPVREVFPAQGED